jgi:hypothetical protein
MTSMNDLLEFHYIQQLKYRYLRALDTHQWDLLSTCFAKAAKVWYAGGAFSHDGRDNVVKFLRELMPDSFISSHIVMHPEIKLTSETTAEGIWRFQDIVHFLEPNPVFALWDIRGGEEMTGAGYYYDNYVKEPDGWKFSSMGYERIFEVIEPRAGRLGLHVTVDPQFGMDRRK